MTCDLAKRRATFRSRNRGPEMVDHMECEHSPGQPPTNAVPGFHRSRSTLVRPVFARQCQGPRFRLQPCASSASDPSSRPSAVESSRKASAQGWTIPGSNGALKRKTAMSRPASNRSAASAASFLGFASEGVMMWALLSISSALHPICSQCGRGTAFLRLHSSGVVLSASQMSAHLATILRVRHSPPPPMAIGDLGC